MTIQRSGSLLKLLSIALAAVLVLRVILLGVYIRQQQAAIREIEWIGGSVETQIGVPEWVWRCLGDERTRIIDDVCYVNLFPTPMSDEDLRHLAPHLRRLRQLRHLVLIDTHITDLGLVELSALTDLEILDLGRVNVTDIGVAHLKALTKLRMLDLSETRVTDGGLDWLNGCGALEELRLERTHVTDSGMKHLKGLIHLEVLRLSGTQVTDAGLEQLKGLTQLRQLWLSETAVTDDGIGELSRALPDLRFER